MIKVMVFGTFDILHQGHLSLFKQAKSLGDELVVVIARNVNVLKFKKSFPKFDEKERLAGVHASEDVDVAVLGHLTDPYKIIEEEKPDIIALGYDQNSFNQGLEARFPEIKIVILEAYKPEIYKSSKLK